MLTAHLETGGPKLHMGSCGLGHALRLDSGCRSRRPLHSLVRGHSYPLCVFWGWGGFKKKKTAENNEKDSSKVVEMSELATEGQEGQQWPQGKDDFQENQSGQQCWIVQRDQDKFRAAGSWLKGGPKWFWQKPSQSRGTGGQTTMNIRQRKHWVLWQRLAKAVRNMGPNEEAF